MAITIESRLGDRLDLLAGVHLLDPLKWEEITAINPGLRLTDGLYLEPGIFIKIPEMLPEKIPDLLPWNDTTDIQLFEPVNISPDIQPGSNPDELLSGSGWLTPDAVKNLLAIPEYTFPLSIAQGGHNATTAEQARANLGAVGFGDIPASIPPSAIGVTVAPLVNGLVPAGNLPAFPPFPTLGELGGVSNTTYTAGLALKLDATARSAANGVAPLGADGLVPSGHLPAPPTLASLGGVSNTTYTTGLALKLDVAARNVANGVAGLDANSLVAVSQIPASLQFILQPRSSAAIVDFNTQTLNHGSIRWIDSNAGHINTPPGVTAGSLIQYDPLFGVAGATGLYKQQIINNYGNRIWERYQSNGTWSAWNERAYLNRPQSFTSLQDFAAGASFKAGAIPSLTTTLTQAGVTAEGLPIYWFVNATAAAGNRLKSIVVATNGNIQIRHHSDDGTVGNIVEMTASGNLLTNGTVRPGSGATAFTGAQFVPGAMYFRTDIAGDGGSGCLTYSDGVSNGWRRVSNGSLVTDPDPGIPTTSEKVISFTTSNTQGGIVQVPHGLNAAKITDISVLVNWSSVFWIGMNYTHNTGRQFQWDVGDTTTVSVINTSGNSGSILSKPGKITIRYTP